jgi:hypothetical protein
MHAGVGEQRAGQIRVREIRASQIDRCVCGRVRMTPQRLPCVPGFGRPVACIPERRVRQVRIVKIGSSDDRVSQNRPTQVGTTEIDSGEISVCQVHASEISVCQVHAGEVDPAEVGIDKRRAGADQIAMHEPTPMRQ